MKIEKQHASVELGNFLNLWLKDANFLSTHNSYVCFKWKGGELKDL